MLFLNNIVSPQMALELFVIIDSGLLNRNMFYNGRWNCVLIMADVKVLCSS